MANNFNLNPEFDQSGRLTTDDEELNRIIRAVEAESGSLLAAAIPAVTFGDDPDEKVYLLLLTMYEDISESEKSLPDYTYKEWCIKTGRQNTYDYLKDLLKHEAIDPNESFIIVGSGDTDQVGNDSVSFESKAITIFRFMKIMFDEHRVLDDGEGFDIDEWNPLSIYGQAYDKTILDV